MTEKSSHPLISVVTRSFRRPVALLRNRVSLQSQTDPDFEQLIIPDTDGKGMLWANTQITKCASKIHGTYVYVLDDDDYLICSSFIADLKRSLAIIETTPGAVIVKGVINDKLYPLCWESVPKRGQIGSPNFLMRRDLFEYFAHYWEQARAGDYHCISKYFKSGEKAFWWDKLVFMASSHSGDPEDEWKW